MMTKILLLVFAEALEAEVMCALENLDVKTYTKFPKIQGVGTHSEPRLDSNIWPGNNIGLLIATDEMKKDKILAEMKKNKTQYEKEGLKVFVLPVEEIL